MEGKTLKDASAQLNLPAGTLAAQVSRGRELLGRRLRKRGLSSVVGVGLLSSPTAELLAATAQSLILPQTNLIAFGIAQGVTTAMITTKIYAVAFGVTATVGIAAGIGFGQAQKPADPVKPVAEVKPAIVEPKSYAKLSLDDEALKPIENDKRLEQLPKTEIEADDDELTVIRKKSIRDITEQLKFLFTRIELGKESLLTILLAVENQSKSSLELCRNDDQRLAVLLRQYHQNHEIWRLTKVLVDAGVRANTTTLPNPDRIRLSVAG